MPAQEENPWRHLPNTPPYALPGDIQAINVFNSRAPEKYRIRLEIFPEPYLGKPDAPVVVLGLNPGFTEADLTQHREPLFAKRSRENLLHAPADYPFYLLDPAIDRTDWWDRKLRWWLKDQTLDRSKVAHGVLCVEYFPYHSRRFNHRALSLRSQRYSFWLVHQALERDAVILMMRGEKCWFGAVPELAHYPRLHRVRAVQNPTITPRNCPGGFEVAAEALRRVVCDGPAEHSA